MEVAHVGHTCHDGLLQEDYDWSVSLFWFEASVNSRFCLFCDIYTAKYPVDERVYMVGSQEELEKIQEDNASSTR